jgi:phage FluMu gp28-like protein
MNAAEHIEQIERESYFLPYQEAWIADNSTLKLAEKSRRVGFTFASSYRMFRKCMMRPGLTQWVSSKDQLTARELITDYIAKWCKLSNIIAEGLYGDNIQVIDPEKNITAFVCVFPNGSRIVSLSSNPAAFAGKGGDVFLDEVDLHLDSATLIDMAIPCIMWGNQLEAVSAYKVNGTKETPWAKMIAKAKEGDNPQGASLHTVTIDDGIDQGLVEKINSVSGSDMTRQEFRKKMRSLCRSLAAWESQFLCIVQDAGGKLIPISKITPCEMSAADLALMIAKYSNAPRFGGYDVARKQHASAWHEYAQIGNGLYLADRQTWHDASFDDQEAWIKSRMADRNKPRISRMAMDATGLGMQMAERMADKFPGRVDQVNLESHRRTELCVMLADRFENQRIFLPEDDQLRADMSGPLRAAAKNGALRIIVPAFDYQNKDTGETETSHCDEFMAAVLANSAADVGASGSDFEIITGTAIPPAFNFSGLGGYSGSISDRRAL